MKDKKIIDFTTGKPSKLILRFFWPLLLTSMLQQLYSFVDVMIVGMGLGDNAFAAVGNMGSLFFLIVGFTFGLANGFGVLLAQSFGAKNYDQLRHRLGCTIHLSVGMAIILTIISIIILPTTLRLINTDPILMNDCLKYGYVVFSGVSMAISYNVSAAVLRALGDSRTPLRAIIISSIINLGLDALFIFVLGMGVEGAASATVFSQLLSSVICINRLRKIDIVKLESSDFKNTKATYMGLIGNGHPMAFMNSITAIGCMVVQHNVNSYGVDYTTAYSACSKYLNLFMNPAATSGNAMSAYTSQNYGAHEYGRIKSGLKVCLMISLVTYALLGTVMVLFPRMLAGILIEGEAATRLACDYLPICGISLIFVDCLFVFRSGVQGMGHPVPTMWSGVLEMFIRIVVVYSLMGTVGFRAAAYAEICAWVGALLFNVFMFSKYLFQKLRGYDYLSMYLKRLFPDSY